MSYSIRAFISVVIFAWVHIGAERTRRLDKISHGRFLSAGGGVAIAYVFIDLLPKLCISDHLVRQALYGIFPFFQLHVYVMALVGFLLFFAVDQVPPVVRKKRTFWMKLASYALFNFLVGYAVVDPHDPEVQPLALFTFAMALHYFVNDFTLNKTHHRDYERFGKWILVGSLFVGWIVGLFFVLSATGVALVSAFIAGGVIMNVTRQELPKENPHSLGAFLIAAAAYTILLLSIGQ